MAYKVRMNQLYKVSEFRAQPRLVYDDDDVDSESQCLYADDDTGRIKSFSSISKSSHDKDASSSMSSPLVYQPSYDEKSYDDSYDDKSIRYHSSPTMPEEAKILPPIPSAISGDIDSADDMCDNGEVPVQEPSVVSRPRRDCKKPDRLQISWT
jgi:hypothetical protein